MLDNLKLLLNITGTDKDDILNLLIDLATSDFEDLTHAVTLGNEDIVLRMAQVRYQKLGREDIESESFSGASTSYSSSYPDDLMRVIKAKRKVIIC